LLLTTGAVGMAGVAPADAAAKKPAASATAAKKAAAAKQATAARAAAAKAAAARATAARAAAAKAAAAKQAAAAMKAAAARAKGAALARAVAAKKATITVAGRTVRVSTVAALITAIDAAQPGDRIELAAGAYLLGDSLDVDTSGTAAAPIVIAAVAGTHPEIRGAARLEIKGSYVTIDGLTFRNGDALKVSATARHARLTRNVFTLAPAAVNWVSVAGDDAEIDHNQFVGKSTAGVFLQVTGPGESEMAQRIWVHHNYFADHTFAGSNGGEALRIGVSARQHAAAHALVEDNLFERVNGDQEAISVKTSDNVIRRNTIRDSKGTITLRHGSNNIVEGNLLIGGTTGIRVFGNDHVVINNIVQDSTRNRLIEVGGGDLRDDHASQGDHDAADRVLVAFNTVVTASKTSTAVDIGDEDDDVHPDTVTVADNILVSGKRAAQAERGTRLSWVGNLGSGSVENVTAGFRVADAKLVKDSGGVYRPATGSAALGTAIGSYSVVTFDVDGQIRPATKRSVGADEVAGGTLANRKPATKLSLGLPG
jgi:poly(beta-D-mannuronate) lyase